MICGVFGSTSQLEITSAFVQRIGANEAVYCAGFITQSNASIEIMGEGVLAVDNVFIQSSSKMEALVLALGLRIKRNKAR